jgi:hypothetical protein
METTRAMAPIIAEVNPLAELELDRFQKAVGDCAEQVARLQRGLVDVPGHRNRLSNAVTRLHSTSRHLLASYQAADKRLSECGTRYTDTSQEREVRRYCDLPSGHQGPHDRLDSALAELVSAELHALADRTATISEAFGWLAPRLQRFLGGRAALTPADRRQAHELVAGLLDVVDAAARQASLLTNDVLDVDSDLRVDADTRTADFAETADMIRERLDQVASKQVTHDPNQLGLF